jgi:predicted metal-dependent HD superfamily phosphohydrolase
MITFPLWYDSLSKRNMPINAREILKLLPEPVQDQILENGYLYLQGVLDSNYNQPHRTYHNLDHVKYMIEHANRLYNEIEDVPEFYAAILFHDLVYDVGAPAGRNEDRSAIMAIEVMKRTFTTEVNYGTVYAFIMSTEHTGTLPFISNDCALIADIDIANFAGSEYEFRKSSERVMNEFVPVVGQENYARGRYEFLKGMLARPKIYYTPHFNENQARRHLSDVTRFFPL